MGFNKSSFVYLTFILVNILNVQVTSGIRKYDRKKLASLREEVRQMFEHAYTSYIKYAYPYDELRPLTCDGMDTWGSYSLTLIDALDTLAVMGNYSEFRRVVDIVTTKADFDANINVSVFETNIRIVGGLISAHLLSQRAGIDVEPGWPCNGPLLRLAEDVAQRLLSAFDTTTGMPYGTVNLRYGVPAGETPITCTAGIGTFILEFATLSRLTGDPVYEEVAMNALKSLYGHQSSIGLFGNHIDVMTGKWTAQDAGIGAGVDSYFEYLVKGSILLQKPELMSMFQQIRKSIDKYLKKNNWYIWASMYKGLVTQPVFQSLEAYWPGVLTLIGDIETALKSMHNYNSVWKQYGFTPEFYNIAQGQAGGNRESYPLRPELAESAMYLYRATGDPFMLDIGLNILRSIQHSAKTPCGYATIKDSRDHTQENRMESFFLAETTKYLYLLFDPDNFIHNNGQHGRLHTLPTGRQCILDAGGYIFNTEAHPIDPGALHCCHDWHMDQLNKGLNMFDFKGNTWEAKEKPIKVPSDKETIGASANNELPFGLADELNSESTSDLTENKVSSDDLEVASDNKNKLNQKAYDDLVKNNEDLAKLLNILKSNKNWVTALVNELEASKKEKVDQEDGVTVEEDDVEAVSPPSVKMNKEDEPTFHSNSEGGLTPEGPPPDPTPNPEWTEEVQIDNTTHTLVSHDQISEKAPTITLRDYVKQLVSIQPPPSKFDPQQLIERIRKSANFNQPAWENDYEVLTCPAQPFLIRLTLSGEFLDYS